MMKRNKTKHQSDKLESVGVRMKRNIFIMGLVIVAIVAVFIWNDWGKSLCV